MYYKVMFVDRIDVYAARAGGCALCMHTKFVCEREKELPRRKMKNENCEAPAQKDRKKWKIVKLLYIFTYYFRFMYGKNCKKVDVAAHFIYLFYIQIFKHSTKALTFRARFTFCSLMFAFMKNNLIENFIT